MNYLTGFPAAAYAAYAAGRGYSGYPSFGLPYPTGNINLATLHHYSNNSHHHYHQPSNHHTLHPLLTHCHHPLVQHPFEHLGVLTTHHNHNHSMHL